MGWGLIWGLLPHINFVQSMFGCPRSPRITKALEIFDLTLVDCWANLYRSQDDVKSWHHDNYQDWTPRPTIYKRFFFFSVEVVVLFFFVGAGDSGRKNLEGHGRGPMNVWCIYLLVKFYVFYGSGHHDFPREYFVCMFIRKWWCRHSSDWFPTVVVHCGCGFSIFGPGLVRDDTTAWCT